MSQTTITPTMLGGLRTRKVEDIPPYLNILIYGQSGVGKTRLAGSADDVPAMRKVLFVDIEGGTFSLKKHNPNVETVRILKWADMQAVYDALFAGSHDYSTVVLDSLTEIQKFDMYEILEKAQKEAAAKGKDNVDEDIAGMREWGRNLEHMRRYVRAFRDLPMNTIFTALVKEDKDPKTGKMLRKPSLSGKLAGEVAAFLDIVGFYYIKEVDGVQSRLLLTHGTEDAVAKDRSDRLPQVLIQPTMEEIHRIISQKEVTTNG